MPDFSEPAGRHAIDGESRAAGTGVFHDDVRPAPSAPTVRAAEAGICAMNHARLVMPLEAKTIGLAE